MTDEKTIWETLQFIKKETKKTPYVNIIDTLWKNFDGEKQEYLRQILLGRELIHLNTNQWEFQLTAKGILAQESDFNDGVILEDKFLKFLESKQTALSKEINITEFMVANFVKPDPTSSETTNESDEGVIFLKNLKHRNIIKYDDETLAHVNYWYVDGGDSPKIKRWFDTLHVPMYVSCAMVSGGNHLKNVDITEVPKQNFQSVQAKSILKRYNLSLVDIGILCTILGFIITLWIYVLKPIIDNFLK